jgi:hypothetical protein
VAIRRNSSLIPLSVVTSLAPPSVSSSLLAFESTSCTVNASRKEVFTYLGHGSQLKGAGNQSPRRETPSQSGSFLSAPPIIWCPCWFPRVGSTVNCTSQTTKSCRSAQVVSFATSCSPSYRSSSSPLVSPAFSCSGSFNPGALFGCDTARSVSSLWKASLTLTRAFLILRVFCFKDMLAPSFLYWSLGSRLCSSLDVLWTVILTLCLSWRFLRDAKGFH